MGRKSSSKGAAERFRRQWLDLIERLQVAYRKTAPDQFEQFPAMKHPCSTCAIAPKTNGWRGMDRTVMGFFVALATCAPFYCHDGWPRTADGWAVDLDRVDLCSAYTVVASIERENLAEIAAAALDMPEFVGHPELVAVFARQTARILAGRPTLCFVDETAQAEVAS